MNKLENDNYISLDEAANYLGIKLVTLRSWIRDPKNEVPAHKMVAFGNSNVPKLMPGYRVESVQLRNKNILG